MACLRLRFLLVCLCALSTTGIAVPSFATTLKSLRVSSVNAVTRLVIDLDSPVQQSWYVNGNRLIIDFKNTNSSANFTGLELDKTAIKSIRRVNLKNNKLRLDIELQPQKLLQQKVQPKIFALKKRAGKDDRLVIDFPESKEMAASNNAGNLPRTTGTQIAVGRQGRQDDSVSSPNPSSVKSTTTSAPNLELTLKRNYLIAVDPGHGGEDSGALGPNNTQEKNVTLAISKELVEQINAQPGYSAKLLRTGDYYLSLQKRRDLAREFKADLLISIHADSFTDSSAYGASVFALSRKGATSEMARFLAQRENDSDLIGRVGGVALDDKSAVLQGVLVDLSMNATVNSSLVLGRLVLNQIDKIAPLHSEHVEQAGFLVLKSPDVPSILVETGFISNKNEAKKLVTTDYQTQMAQAVLKGVKLYFEQHPPTTLTSSVVKSEK